MIPRARSKEKARRPSSKPNACPVKIGDFLSPTLLPDYSPEKLALKTNKLVQYDTTDIEGNLIPAYDIAKYFRPGTVVVVEAELHIYNISQKKGAPQPLSAFNRFYSITATRIRVVAESLQSLEPSPEATPSPPHASTSTEPDIFSLLPTPQKKRGRNADQKRRWRPTNGRIALSRCRALHFPIRFRDLFLSYFECFSLLRLPSFRSHSFK